MQTINTTEPTGGCSKGRTVCTVPFRPNQPPTDFTASLKLTNVTQIDYCVLVTRSVATKQTMEKLFFVGGGYIYIYIYKCGICLAFIHEAETRANIAKNATNSQHYKSRIACSSKQNSLQTALKLSPFWAVTWRRFVAG